MRLNLAQALMSRSDLLLLDEPTNHLDLDAVLWLEDWLARYPGTLLLITHDRDFLDGVAQSIVHIDAQRLRSYTGNYSAFERERAQQLALQQATYEKQQRQIAHLQSFVDRFRAKATKAKQAQSRLKTLEKMERIAAAHVDSPFEFAFASAGLTARQLVRLEQATLRYGDGAAGVRAPRLEPARRRAHRPARPERRRQIDAGQGDSPERCRSPPAQRYTAQNLRIGYFAQHQLEQLDRDATPLGILAATGPRGARAGAARFPRRLRFSRRDGDRGRGQLCPAARRRGWCWR